MFTDTQPQTLLKIHFCNESRSSHSNVFSKITVLKNFTNLERMQRAFLVKIQELLQRDSNESVFQSVL